MKSINSDLQLGALLSFSDVVESILVASGGSLNEVLRTSQCE